MSTYEEMQILLTSGLLIIAILSMIHPKYRTVSVRMLFRECSCKNAGVAGYAEAFTTVLSGKQTSET